MSEAERRVPGEQLAERMQRRTHRRPRLGMSPTFYARLGLDDPWAVEGADMAPAPGGDDMVFLSAAPYYAMMRKLAAARKRRERRLQRFLGKRAGVTLRAGSSALPSLGVPGAASSLPARRITALSLSDMSLPTPAPTASPGETTAPVAATDGRSERPSSWRPATKVANPWLDTPYTPARVAEGGREARPAERVAARLASAQEAAQAERVVGTLPPSAQRRVARAKQRIEIEEAAPVQLSEAEVVRVVRRARVARPMVRIVEEEIAPPAAARPTQTATTRMVDGASRGLRPLALRSPAMAVAMADLAHAADVDRAAAQALAAPERGESMRPAAARRVPPTQRALGRAGQARSSGGPEASLSASPVSSSRTASARPVAASPVARQGARDGGAGGPSHTTSSSTRSLRVPASAAAAARLPLVHAPAPGAQPVEPTDAPATLALDARGAVVRASLHASQGDAVARRTVRVASAGALARIESSPADVSRPQLSGQVDSRSVVPRPVAHARASALVPSSALAGAPQEAAAAPLHATAPIASRTATGHTRFVPARLARASRLAASVPTPVVPRALGVEPSGPADLDLGFGGAPAPSGQARLPEQRTGGKVIRGAVVEPVPSTATVASRAGAATGTTSQPATGPITRGLPAAEERAILEGRRPARVAPPSRLDATRAPTMGGAAWALSRLDPAVDATAARPTSLVPRPVAPSLVTPSTPSSQADTGREPAARAVVARGEAQRDARGEPVRPGSPARLVAPEAVLPARPGGEVAARPPARDADRAGTVRPAAVAPVAEPAARPRAVAVATRADRAVAPRRPLAVAAGERADRVQGRPSARVEQATEAAAATPSRRDLTRRSGPLSWAHSSIPEASLVASPARAAAASAPQRGAARLPRALPEATLARRDTPVGGDNFAARDAGSRRDTGAPERVGAVLPVAAPSTRAIVEELSARGLLSNRYSPTTPVRTPDGRYISARVAAALPGLAVLPALAGPVAIATEPARRAPGFRTPEVRFVGAPIGAAAEGAYTAARSTRTRPTDWVAARTAVTEATAYRGAIGVGTPESTFRAARVATTPTTEFVGAGTSTGAAPSPAVRRSRNVAPAATPVAPLEATPAVVASPVAAPVARRARPAMESTLIDMASDAQPTAAAPNWAQRAEGRPLVRSAQGLFDSLARATTAEQVVAVIAQRAGGFGSAVPLTEPMREVVEQIRQEISAPAEVAEPVVLATRAPEVDAPRATVLRGARVEPVRGSARTSRGSVRPVRSSAVVRGPGGGDDRISKLVKRLTDLIHLAEDQRRLSEAQSQVRMAEDTEAARAEGQAPMGQSAAGGVKLDIETFTREVLEVVNRELELRRERRMEDSDESGWW